ncbi:MAG: hypothetical protein COV67_07260, partial [Nitrospinae bacterium CG11_big_fil_rev_8_21_14_0_20_56_8]
METENALEDVQDLIRVRIEKLRPKLLDLSRRNPLISTRLSPRRNALLRVVDELPNVLAFNLCNQEGMRFVSLPSLDGDPKDEQSEDFQDALSGARLTDEEYLRALEELDPDDDESIERDIERKLKDRVRASLGMAPHQKKADVSLPQHALNNGICPHYELPDPEDEHEDGRHGAENIIQTLLLPEDMERRLNALMTKCRTWEQETGINVFHAAFGFLEWAEANSSESSFAPLVLLPVKMEKQKTKAGVEFWVTADGDDTETNFVIAEKLRLEFGIDLPPFQGGSIIEEYLREVTEAAPPAMKKWKVRRQVAFGVFPSARMAMYEDTGRPEIAANPLVAGLFGGTTASGDMPFADEYDIDRPEIEVKVPYLVMDADSSQFSTIVDVADGKNLAVEGPPGTGKSQTIINTIANAVVQGKKVLFVAEKMAALEVVKSRLEAIGLGEFLLPLQAERSTREQVIASIRSRLEMSAAPTPRDYETRIERFRQIRSELAAYIDTISASFGQTGLTVHDVLGKSIATNDVLKDAPQRLQSPPCIADVETYDQLKRETIRERADALAKAWKEAEATASYWRGLKIKHLNRFTATGLTQQALNAGNKYETATRTRQALEAFAIDPAQDVERLRTLVIALEALVPLLPDLDASLVVRTCRTSAAGMVRAFRVFLDDCGRFHAERKYLAQILADTTACETPETLRKIVRLCEAHDIDQLDMRIWREDVDAREEALNGMRRIEERLKSFVQYFPAAKTIPIDVLAKAGELVRTTDREVIAIRNESTAEPLAKTLITHLCQQGRDLCHGGEQLAHVITLPEEITVSALRAHVEVIKNAGAFGWLSTSFWAAKRTYATYSRREKFDREQATKDFQEVANWKEATHRFGNDPQARTLFGLHWKGLDTDFGLFERLAAFYEQVEELFSGVEYRDIRVLLKTGESDLLYSIPDLPPEGRQGTFAELRENIDRNADDLTTRTELVAHLKALLSALSCPAEMALSALPELADRLERLHKLGRALDTHSAMQALLQDSFKGCDTAPEQFQTELEALTIIEGQEDYTSLLADLLETSRIHEAALTVGSAIRHDEEAADLLSALAEKSGIPFGDHLKDRPYQEIAQYLREASEDNQGLFAHSSLATARAEIEELGFGWAVDAMRADKRPLAQIAALLEAAVFRAMAMRVYEIHGTILSRYPGTRLDELRSSFAKLDKKIIRLTRQHLRATVRETAKPPAGNGWGRKSTWTEMALIENEVSKKKRYIPVRDLTRRAGKTLLELKPCWMMSPLAVAQYLPQDTLFNLCIIDEASQMPPEDAIGALARCRQVMVVGDTNQLPPTSFFKKMLEDEDVDEDEAVLDESILEMANGVFRPARRLRWHYRSRHSGLIQFSNKHIYDNNLVVFPSPNESHPDMGVSLVSVEGGYRAGINAEEASAMISAVLRFVRTNPDRSLGVVTLNQKQRDLLLEEWDRALARDTAATSYVEDWAERRDGLESFFIKNLENVQGDERDVIFIGTVYGPETPGAPVMQRFGPISGLAGKRRLNVLFSRAKQQIVTFSSMTAADIRADEHGNSGAYMLKCWLEYSSTGKLHVGEHENREPDSDFEVFVINQLHAMGVEPVPQVGVAGYRIDIGIKHPAWPHGFIMGVECDGATYHSSRSARDRDRLREEVLGNLGWHLHRIWSTDWFNDPAREAERLRQAVENRLVELQNSSKVTDVPDFLKEKCAPVGPDEAEPVSNIEEKAATSSPEIENRQPNDRPLLSRPDVVEVGDRITVRYLSGEQSVREI